MTESPNNLYGIAFDDPYKADEARALFKRMAGEGLLSLEETAVAIKGSDGKVKITQDLDVTANRQNQGHMIGIVASAVTGVSPLIFAGTVAGRVIGRLTDHGLTSKAMKPIADALKPETSALFLLGKTTSDESRERIIERIRHFNPEIIETSVPPDLRASIEKMLEEEPASA